MVETPEPTLLVIDDDAATRRLIAALFVGENIRVLAAADGPSGLARADADRPDVVLLDFHLPGLGGLEVLEQLRARADAPAVVMVTAHHDLKTAVRATQLGAADYLTKPVDGDEVVKVVRRVLETRALRREVAVLRRQLGSGGGLTALMGPSTAARQVVEQVEAVAATDFSVLVLGETGTGKELVAQAIHRESPRRDRVFIALDCGAIPDALLESELFGYEKGAFTGAERRRPGQLQLAHGGTLFLDEIGNLPQALQVKLLRVLESRQVQPLGGAAASFDVRIIAATNDDLDARVAGGRFRADLYFRLAQYSIRIPPLRDRVDDVAPLAQRFLEEVRVELRRPVQELQPDALEALKRHRWPGNVRELRNVVRQAVLRTDGLAIGRDTVRAILGTPATADGQTPAAAVGGRSLRVIADEAARAAERRAIDETLRATRGNKARAARVLETDYKTLYLKMKRLGIRSRDYE